MNKLILCEGKTDAILLSYYLGKTAGWKFVKKGPSGLAIQQPNDNESISWYKNIVDKTAVFVRQMRTEADKYINGKITVESPLGCYMGCAVS
ncbi:MAG: hypothetical protein ACI4F1_05520 [Bariatricus sp.]